MHIAARRDTSSIINGVGLSLSLSLFGVGDPYPQQAPMLIALPYIQDEAMHSTRQRLSTPLYSLRKTPSVVLDAFLQWAKLNAQLWRTHF